MTLLTVLIPTPANVATSRIVGRLEVPAEAGDDFDSDVTFSLQLSDTA
ncbi:hypothetical protein [Leifsonia sp. P73]